jgi:hypothetical protein
MANEFRIKNGFESQGNSNVTGSLTVTAGVTASLQGTASFATSASNALTASFVNPLRQTVEVQPPLFNSYGITVNPSAQSGIIAVGSINGGRFNGEGKNTTVYGVIGDTAFNGDPEAGDTLPEAIGGSFRGTQATANYSVQLQDGTEGVGKVLVSQTSDGKANWAQTVNSASRAISASFASTASYVVGGGSTNTGSLLTTASFADPYITFTKGGGSTFNVNLTGISSQSPQATYATLTASISSGTTVTLPGGLTYVSSSTYEYIEVHVNGLQLRYDIDFIPTTTGSVKYLLTIPSGSEIIYKSYKRP